MRGLWIPLLAGLMLSTACGGGGSTPAAPITPQLAGNWQFTVASPSDISFTGGLRGGFLQQADDGSVTGQIAFSIFASSFQGGTTPCNSGSATITGTLKGQNVTLSAQAGTETNGGVSFTFSGQLNSDNSIVAGTYTSTAGTAPDGTTCGTAQSGLQWSAVSVPPLMGTLQGNFHSTGGAAGLQDQDFLVNAILVQGENTGASSATLTGTLNAPATASSTYPCLSTASVTGQISGNSVILQIFANNGLNVGQIGNIAQGQAVTFDRAQDGYVLHNSAGNGYAVNTKPCPGASLANAGDSGNICLSLSGACNQSIALFPGSLPFPPQTLGSAATSLPITLTNSDPSNATLSGLQLHWTVVDGAFNTPSDFDGLSNFTESDTCATPFGSTFTLAPQQSCTITISFSPQQSCPWLPLTVNSQGQPGAPPAQCPLPTAAKLTVISPKSADHDNNFVVPITGIGLSALVPSVSELDFGAESVGEASSSQMLTFTNQSTQPVQILPAAASPCGNGDQITLPHPLQNDGTVDGIRVVRTDSFANILALPPTITYFCDSDAKSGKPNLQISSDTCTGTLLDPLSTCSLQVAFVPQPGTDLAGPQAKGLDYFLQLNTLQCSSSDNVSANCEIDSGRFPVEIKTNPPSPLRMSPGAALEFGLHLVGQVIPVPPLTVTLLNDPNAPDAATVNFTSFALSGTDYVETNDCGSTLTSGSSCTITVTFTPKIVGIDKGIITISYNNGQIQTIHLRGTGQ